MVSKRATLANYFSTLMMVAFEVQLSQKKEGRRNSPAFRKT